MRLQALFFYGLVTALCAGLGGCATFHAKPIVPEKTAAAFSARRLDDAGLKKFLESNLHHELNAWPFHEWDFETLTLAALYYHPDLEVARAQLEAAQAHVITAGGRPNPSLHVSPGYNVDAVDVSPWLYGFTFDLPIETAGKRGYRILWAERLTEAAWLESAETAWVVRHRLREALADHLLSLRGLALWRAEEGLRADIVALMERRRQAGLVSLPELTAARAELASVKLALRTAEGRVAESRASLAASLGLPVSALEGVALSWPQMDLPPTEDDLSQEGIQRTGLLNRLDVRRALADYAAAEAALQLEIAKQYPDLQLSPGYKFDDGDNKFSLGISLTLPLFNQNQGPIAEAEARCKESAARFRALQTQVISDLERARARYHAAVQRLAEATRSLADLRQRQEQMTQLATSGQTDPLLAVNLLLQRTRLTRARLDALREMQIVLGELENAVQRPLQEATP